MIGTKEIERHVFPTRRQLIEMLRGKTIEKNVALMAALTLEKDVMVISDLRNRVSGMSRVNAELRRQLEEAMEEKEKEDG